MNLTDILKNDFVDLDARLSLKLTVDVPFIGKQEVFEVKLRGFEDKDKDFKPEFHVEVEVMNHDIVPPLDIELDPMLIIGAMGGGVGSMSGLLKAITDGYGKKGIKLPFNL